MAIKVIHSFPIWLPRTQIWMYNQVHFLPAERIEAHIVCEQTQNLNDFNVSNIHCLNDYSKLNYYCDKVIKKVGIRHHLGFLIRHIRLIGAQLIHSHFGSIGWENLDAARKTGIKHVVTFYGQDVNRLPVSQPVWNTRYHRLFEEVDGVLCEGKFMAGRIIELGCSPEIVNVQHLGVDVDGIQYLPRIWDGIGALRILIAAGFREKKGIPDGLDALGRLHKEIPIEITIVGDASHDPDSIREKRSILEAIDRNHLKGQTRLLGFQPYSVLLREAYAHHIFLSPNHTAIDGDTEGGAPVSLIDMAATGMPIVSTLHCDIPEIIRPGITGLLVEERDIDGLSNSIRWLAEHTDQWRSMLDAGRKWIETEYNAIIQGQKLACIYESVINTQN